MMKPAVEIPNTNDLLKDFAERHHLELTDILEHERIVVRATAAANILITAGYAGLDDTALLDPAVGILLNMFHRRRRLSLLPRGRMVELLL